MYGQGTCSAYLPNGINKTCIIPLAEVASVIFTNQDVTFDSLSDVLNLATWKGKIQEDLEVYVVAGVYDYENTTDDPNIITLGSTKKLITNEPIPSAKLLLESNFCDYLEVMKSFKQGTYGIIYMLRDGQMLMWKDSTGKPRPFTANLVAISKHIPGKSADIANSYPLFVNHQSVAEFKDAILVNPAWNASVELIAAMPIGLNMTQVSVVTAGDVDVYVSERCGEAVENLVVGDFEVLDSSGLVTTVVAVAADNDGGSYTLTLQKGSAVDIAAGEYMVIRIKHLNSAIVEMVSNRLYIQA